MNRLNIFGFDARACLLILVLFLAGIKQGKRCTGNATVGSVLFLWNQPTTGLRERCPSGAERCIEDTVLMNRGLDTIPTESLDHRVEGTVSEWRGALYRGYRSDEPGSRIDPPRPGPMAEHERRTGASGHAPGIS
jgi:hypothetical protein